MKSIEVIVLEEVYTLNKAMRLSRQAPMKKIRREIYLTDEIVIGNPFELDVLEVESTPQGLFIKTWRGLQERPQFIVIKGICGIVEILTFSIQQLNCFAGASDKWDKDAMIDLSFYDGIQFTDRVIRGKEKSLWNDAQVIYKGAVDDSKIYSETYSKYDVWCDTKKDLKELNYVEE